MTYEWESQFIIAGVALVNADSVEGCFKLSDELAELPALERADVLKDILGDIQARYDEALEDLARG